MDINFKKDLVRRCPSVMDHLEPHYKMRLQEIKAYKTNVAVNSNLGNIYLYIHILIYTNALINYAN